MYKLLGRPTDIFRNYTICTKYHICLTASDVTSSGNTQVTLHTSRQQKIFSMNLTYQIEMIKILIIRDHSFIEHFVWSRNNKLNVKLQQKITVVNCSIKLFVQNITQIWNNEDLLRLTQGWKLRGEGQIQRRIRVDESWLWWYQLPLKFVLSLVGCQTRLRLQISSTFTLVWLEPDDVAISTT